MSNKNRTTLQNVTLNRTIPSKEGKARNKRQSPVKNTSPTSKSGLCEVVGTSVQVGFGDEFALAQSVGDLLAGANKRHAIDTRHHRLLHYLAIDLKDQNQTLSTKPTSTLLQAQVNVCLPPYSYVLTNNPTKVPCRGRGWRCGGQQQCRC